MELHKLVENPKNPNKHPDDQIDRLAKIIDYQGQRAPIVVSKLSGFITKGHGRLLALKKLGWEKVAVDYQDYDDEAQEYADIVADNAIAQWADMDMSMVNTDFIDFGPDLDIDILGLKDFSIEPMDKYGDDLKSVADLFIEQNGEPIKKEKYWLSVNFDNETDFDFVKTKLSKSGGRELDDNRFLELIKNAAI